LATVEVGVEIGDSEMAAAAVGAVEGEERLTREGLTDREGDLEGSLLEEETKESVGAGEAEGVCKAGVAVKSTGVFVRVGVGKEEAV